MKKNYKQQAVQTFYNVMNYLVMDEKNRTIELPEWFIELSGRIQKNQIVEDELSEIFYLLDKRITNYFGSDISRQLIPTRYMA